MEQTQYKIYWKLFELIEADGYDKDEAISEAVSYLTVDLNIEESYAQFLAEKTVEIVLKELQLSLTA